MESDFLNLKAWKGQVTLKVGYRAFNTYDPPGVSSRMGAGQFIIELTGTYSASEGGRVQKAVLFRKYIPIHWGDSEDDHPKKGTRPVSAGYAETEGEEAIAVFSFLLGDRLEVVRLADWEGRQASWREYREQYPEYRHY